VKILAIEPYHGGSHARFLNELTTHLPFEFEVLALPARAWKWRMRLAAPYFADLLNRRAENDEGFDLLFSSSFLDLPSFRGMVHPRIARLPAVVYWHENQLAYPVREAKERDRHFGVTNILTALAADLNLFNSQFNLNSLTEGVGEFLKAAPDMLLENVCERIQKLSRVLPVPLDLQGETPCADPRPEGAPIILWNHRWEHDKNPASFLNTVMTLAAEPLEFRVAVVGQSFRQIDPLFQDAKLALEGRIEAWGHVASRKEYLALLRRCHIVVSTARHEFQGLSIMEAVAQGCRPLLPNRLAYPEFFSDSVLYKDDQDLLSKLRSWLQVPQEPDKGELQENARRHSWQELGPKYQQAMETTRASSRQR